MVARRPWWTAAMLSMGVVAGCEVSTEPPTPRKGFSPRREAREVEAAHVYLLGPINAEREAARVAPLVVEPRLNAGAQLVADALAKGDEPDLWAVHALIEADGPLLASFRVLRGEGSPADCIEGWKRDGGTGWSDVRLAPYALLGAGRAERPGGVAFHCVLLGEPMPPKP